jgi:protein TonB
VGQAGGVANGVQNGQAQSTEQRTAPADEGTYELSAVEEQPELSNRSEVARQLSRNYPPLLRDAGVVGTVTVRMRGMENGSVDPESVASENSTHEAFGDAAKRVVERMRFRPAKVGGRAVKVWVTLPVTFQLET